jgi:hypothetical protein
VRIFNELHEEQPGGWHFVRATTPQPPSIHVRYLLPTLCSFALSVLPASRVWPKELSVVSLAHNPAPVAPQTKPSDLPDLQNSNPAVSPIPIPEHLSQDPQYLVRPRARDPKTIKPITTMVVVDGNSFTHQSQFEISTGVDAGDQRSTNMAWNANWLTGVELQESTSKNRIYRREYRSQYSRFSSVRQQREVATTVIAPETVSGFRQQFSLMADCLPGTAPLGTDGKPQTCTYLPGISTEQKIDPQRLKVKGLTTTSEFQDVVSPASVAAIRQPGFQKGANGEEFGVDIYVPVTAVQAGNTQGITDRADRRESIVNAPAITVGKMRQVVLSNGNENALARTIRGFTYVGGDPNFSLNTAVTLAANALPDAEPSLPPGGDGRLTFSTTLFAAANNARVPSNSFTAYSVGWGRSRPPKEPAAIPTANYHGIWIGLSPIVHRQLFRDKTYQILGPEIITNTGGNEGGIEAPITIDVSINGQKFTNSALNNSYSQVYVTNFDREVNGRYSSVVRERTSYNPHLSFTGNVTTADSLLRYYTGGIFIAGVDNQPQTVQAYLGGDFTKEDSNGLSYRVGAIGYVNPNPENYSQINANISKQIPIGSNSANFLVLSSSAVYALDGSSPLSGALFQSGNSYVNVGANARFGDLSFGTTYYIPTGLPNELESILVTNISWRFTDRFAISGYYTPINDNISRSTFGASASWRLGKDYNDPTVSLSWNRNEIDFGRGSTTPINNYSDNVFGVYFRFGAPGNPFVPANP